MVKKYTNKRCVQQKPLYRQVQEMGKKISPINKGTTTPKTQGVHKIYNQEIIYLTNVHKRRLGTRERSELIEETT